MDNSNNIINDIFEIFGIGNSGENEIDDEKPEFVPVTTTEFMVDDGLLSESTTKTTTKSTTASTTTRTTTTSTTTTTTTTTTTATTTTLRSSTVSDSENIPT